MGWSISGDHCCAWVSDPAILFTTEDTEFTEVEGWKCLHRTSVNCVHSVVDFQRTSVDV
jgi:hypothetical protein